MDESMRYDGEELNVLVVFPQVAGAIKAWREKMSLPDVMVEELSFGLAEVVEVSNRLDATLLAGPKATISGFLDILPQKHWHVIWLITHCVAEGWFLNDGIVNASETTALIRSSRAFLTVMNTCTSIEVAETVAEELGTAFIYTVREVPDRTAFITGVLFAQHLAAGVDYVDAFHLARPGQDRTYRLIEARTMPMLPPERGRPQRSRSEESSSQRLERTQDEIELIVFGSARLGLLPLRDVLLQVQRDIASLQADSKDLKEKFDAFQKTADYRNRLMVGVVILLVVVVIILAIRIGG